MQTDTKDHMVIEADEGRTANLPAQVRPSEVAAPVQQTTPMDLLRIVTERGASIEEIGKYMDLMDRQEAKMARQAYVRAIAGFKKSPPDIYKNKSVGYMSKDGDFVGYQHATLGNICEQIIGALAEHSISHAWSIEQPPSGMIRVTCTLTHEMGHSEVTAMEAPADNSGKKNAIQSIASSITYLERYTLLAACGIAVKEQGDDDGQGAGKQVSSLADKWLAVVAVCKTDEAVLTTWTEGLAEIEKAKDRQAYALFKDAVANRRAELAPGDAK